MERSDSTQIVVRNWWNIGGTVVVDTWCTIGGQMVVRGGTQNWWNLVFHGFLFFLVFPPVPPMVELVEHWWKTVGQIRGARIEKHFVQH